MPFIISNPWGFLALLGIPAVLAIHFLQRRSIVLPCSTLFLLHQTQRESKQGRKFDKLIQSLALWMQLLAVLLLTILLVQPRYIKPQSTQRIAIVIDSSASMSVYKAEAKAKILEQVPKLQAFASQLELWLLDSDLSRDRVYHGESIEELMAAIDNWQPQSGTANPHHVLRIARSLTGHDGALLYITDTPSTSIPYNATMHAIGHPENNVGFTGITMDELAGEVIWKASIRNYSTQALSRQWYLANDANQRTAEQTIQFAPGELKVVTGKFPDASKRCEIRLSTDTFSYDDVMPIIKPQPKELAIHLELEEPFAEFGKKLLNSFDNVLAASSVDTADLIMKTVKSDTTKLGVDPAIVFLKQAKAANTYSNHIAIATDHALTEGLNWQKLLISEGPKMKLIRWDTPLVWSGEDAIIFLRDVPVGLGKTRQQLVFNFDLSHSNAYQQECIALLLYRFIETQRKKKSTLQQIYTELSQPLELNIDPKGKQTTLETYDLNGKILNTQQFSTKQPLRAPDTIGFFSVKQGDKTLLHGANYFADTREADLSKCQEGVIESNVKSKAVDQHTNQDHLWRIWVLLVLSALLLSWKRQASTSPTS